MTSFGKLYFDYKYEWVQNNAGDKIGLHYGYTPDEMFATHIRDMGLMETLEALAYFDISYNN